MLKKSLLVVMASFGLFSHVHADRDSDMKFWVSSIVASGAVVGTGVYLACRESNEVKMQRAQALYDFYKANLFFDLAKIVTSQDIEQFLNKSTKFKKEMLVFTGLVNESYREIYARYGSWIKPWNWTLEMKHAFKQIRELKQITHLVNIMCSYQLFFINVGNNYSEEVIAKGAQFVSEGLSSYPVMSLVYKLRQDLSFLRETNFKISLDIVLIEKLEQILQAVLISKAYVDEKRAQEEFILKQRQTAAQEEQARAQQDQANAQQAQARALREQAHAQQEQTRAIKERNRIEQEKLDRQ